MALIPTNGGGAETKPASDVNPFQAAMTAALEQPTPVTPPMEAPPEPEPAAVETPPAAPEPPKEPEAPKDPEKELEKPTDDPKTKLPIDELDELDAAPDEPTEGKAAKDPAQMKAERRIEEISKELKNVWKPKVTELEESLRARDEEILALKGASDELAELRQFKADAESELSVVKLEKTEVFKKEITDPLNRIEERARAIAETYGIDEDKMFKAFGATEESERRKLFKEATDGLDVDPDDALDLKSLIREAQPIFTKRDELYQNSQAALSELEARREKESASEAAARAAARVSATELVASRVASKLPEFKEIVDLITADVKAMDFDTLDVEKKAYYATAGAALPKITAAFRKLQAEYDSALDDLAAYQKAEPRVGGLHHSDSANPPKPKSLQEGLLKGLGFAS